MTKFNMIRRMAIGTAAAAITAGSLGAALPAPAMAQSTVKPSNDVTLSVGTGRMVRLDGNMTDVFVANSGIADVQVRSANQLYIFGKAGGETTVFATDKAGRTVYSANVQVGTNIGSIDELLRIAMPEAQIEARPVNGMVLLTGTVAAPTDVEEANRLVQAFVGEGTQVISRLKTATPLQVMLQVKIAEVSRSLTRGVGVNLTTLDPTGGKFGFALGRGRDITRALTDGTLPIPSGTSSIGGIFADVLGLDVAAAIDLNENSGLVTTLAEPTLTALSGETASFLAGGEFPIPISQGIDGTAIEFKEYGVSLAFTPTVLEGGRISMRVRPEVSELSSAGALKVNGFEIPGLSTRRTETTVELGSGQSFMLAGLLSNTGNNSIERTPGLGNLPIIGALFRSNSFRKSETELVIIVTPYLVRPVNARDIALPTDGYRSPTTAERVLLGTLDGKAGGPRPGPTAAPPRTVQPSPLGTTGAAALPRPAPARPQAQTARASQPSAAPGFSF
ncbi:MAG TPA: type II and III secretion system protein family protein [Allosphingosinicella sp.]